MTDTYALLDVEEGLLRQEELILEATERLSSVMENEGVTKTELARRLGKSKSYVTQCLSGRGNLTLRTLADLFGALGYMIRIEPRTVVEEKLLKIISFSRSESWVRQPSEASRLTHVHEPAIESQAHALGVAA